MTDDLDLLRRYMRDGSGVDFDLQETLRRFEAAVESDAQGDGHGAPEPLQVRRLRKRSRRLVVMGGVGAAVAALLLVVLIIPNIGPRQPVAAAAELRQIASNAASQTAPQLGVGQYLSTEERVSLFASVTQVGPTQTPDAQATIAATVNQWTDEYGDTCISATSTPAQFATPANQAAWKAAGVLDSPNGQPDTSCVTNSPSPFGSPTEDGGIIDVSHLPTDPSVLAHQLSTGTTGISGLDQLSLPKGENVGFDRAVYLLVSPAQGVTPAFTSALYGALALIPGIAILGDMTTHSGATGLGFTGDSTIGKSVIVVNPTNGVLLEARNIESPTVYTGLGASYLAPPPTPSIGTEGGSYGLTVEWLDPVGSPTVVDSLPSGLSLSQPTPVPAAIKGITDRNVTYAQVSSLQDRLTKLLGSGISSFSAGSPALEARGETAPTAPGGKDVGIGWTLEFEFGSVQDMREAAQVLEASGLFVSITQYEGKAGTTPDARSTSGEAPAPASIVREVSTIPASVYNEVGVPAASATPPVSQPIVLSDQPPLTLHGKTPSVLWDGAGYCPYCAAERWALTAALSRFGTWSNLTLISSSSSDVDPGTHSFSYDGATYTSPYLTFGAIDPVNAASQPPSRDEQAVLNKYANPKYLPGEQAGQGAIPFLDVDNVALISGASFNPGVLAGLSWTTIATDLSNPDSPVTRAIVGTANYITAAICSSIHGAPASVCNSPGVVAAANALKLR